jgi:hypothetical protein
MRLTKVVKAAGQGTGSTGEYLRLVVKGRGCVKALGGVHRGPKYQTRKQTQKPQHRHGGIPVIASPLEGERGGLWYEAGLNKSARSYLENKLKAKGLEV